MGKGNQVLLLCLLLMLTVVVSQTHGARHSQVFKVKPRSQNSTHHDFLGFLPKAWPIPPSGPSKKHNSIGLQSSRGSP
ncbi:hypothetical protein I3843_16G014700 [Carya illinoinensis]|uniref:Uncharacterized protein n=1 Tax=Carya illinoinensis TaxID=32201 RepID=A0A8T1N3B5_CARIL|nr:hypothetical protein I3760_16G013000 [Carya illinoinensis]KAG6624272.1 hypothetical protein CIPAW_16G014800 [Carya illinoinensis]KAG6671637.1 hypothetical protein I3842_16G013500 [Carya illinoinensis]KAG7940977.1 hypothetical protein I3843_16G014700 [Carya illinoinensis]